MKDGVSGVSGLGLLVAGSREPCGSSCTSGPGIPEFAQRFPEDFAEDPTETLCAHPPWSTLKCSVQVMHAKNAVFAPFARVPGVACTVLFYSSIMYTVHA